MRPGTRSGSNNNNANGSQPPSLRPPSARPGTGLRGRPGSAARPGTNMGRLGTAGGCYIMYRD